MDLRDYRIGDISRRELLGAGGGAFATALAGCTNLAGGGGETTRFVTAFEGGRPATTIQMNPYNPSEYGGTYLIHWNQRTSSAHTDGSVTTQFFETFEADGRELTIEFPDDFTFWNGNDITAEDYYVEAEISRHMDPEGSIVERHELDGDYTVRRIYKDDITPTLAKLNSVNGLKAPKSVFREWLERYEEATTTNERESVTQEFLQMTIPTEEYVEKGLGSGLFEIKDFNSSETLGVKRDDHPWADRTDIEEIRLLPNIESGTQVDQLARNNELDMIDYIPENQISGYPDDLENYYKLNHYNTQKYMLNWNNPHLARRPVRRAIISAIDIPAIVDAARQAGTLSSPTQVQTGIRDTIEDKFLGKGFTDKLIQYPVKADKETATAYMKDAGYTLENGAWVGPDGGKINFKIITQSAVSQSQPTNVFSDQLNDFGMATEVNAIGDSYYTQIQEFEFDIAWMWHVAVANWHPKAYFSNNFYGILVGDPKSENETGPTGVPFSLEIPKEVGAKQIDNGVEIKPAQLMRDLDSAASRKEVMEITRKLVRWVNYDLPAIVHLQENRGFGGDTANFQFPNPNETRLDRPNPGPWALTSGYISSK